MPLGTTCTFDVEAPDEETWSAFVRYENVLYPTPVAADRQGTGQVSFFPECPGDYELDVTWTGREGDRGIARCPLSIDGGKAMSLSPIRARADGHFHVWAPTGWDGLHVNRYEHAALAAVRRTVKAGAAAYDIGANLGLYTLPLLQLAGASGMVYAFEFNPVCVTCLQATLKEAHYRNGVVIPVAIGRSDGTLDATINYGSTAVGITAVSGFFAAKVGAPVTVPCLRLDTAIERFSLRPPDFVKVDVEGAEAMVVEGMEQTLARHRPILLFELHGRGAAQATLQRLEPFRYTFEDLDSARRADSAVRFMEGLPERPVQVICVPR
ncbi:MAG: FkbM family methyltransferase [Acidobacteriota bacterium]